MQSGLNPDEKFESIIYINGNSSINVYMLSIYICSTNYHSLKVLLGLL